MANLPPAFFDISEATVGSAGPFVPFVCIMPRRTFTPLCGDLNLRRHSAVGVARHHDPFLRLRCVLSAFHVLILNPACCIVKRNLHALSSFFASGFPLLWTTAAKLRAFSLAPAGYVFDVRERVEARANQLD